MKTNMLLPQRSKWIGLAILLPFLCLGIFNLYHEFEFSWLAFKTGSKSLTAGNQNLTDELALTGIITGLMLMSFARVKNEDEFITALRLESWQWAVLIQFLLLLAAIWLVYDMHFMYFMIYNMLTVLVIFLVRFHYLLYHNRITHD
jgi:hypothetical protein